MLWMHNIAVNQILLCFNTFCLEEFSDCDEAETFGLQYGNELIDSSNSLFVALEIVEQEDDTVTCTSCQALYTLFGSGLSVANIQTLGRHLKQIAGFKRRRTKYSTDYLVKRL